MNGKDIELSRRRVLGGIATIGAASAAAGAGTFAYFSDTETSDGNTVSAGTLDLTGGGDGFATVTFGSEGDESALVPGDSGFITWDLANEGSMEGFLNVNIGEVNGDGEWVGASLASENDGTGDDIPTTGTEPDPSGSDLDDALNITATLGNTNSDEGVHTDSDPTFDGENDEFVTSTPLSGALGQHDRNFALSRDSTTQLTIEYELPGDSTSNWVQGDSVTFDVQVELNQQNSS